MAERISGHGTLARALVGVTASLALLVGLVTAGRTVRWVQLRRLGTGQFDVARPSGSPTPAATGECAHDACNYLLLGSDSRAGLSPEQQEQFGRASCRERVSSVV